MTAALTYGIYDRLVTLKGAAWLKMAKIECLGDFEDYLSECGGSKKEALAYLVEALDQDDIRYPRAAIRKWLEKGYKCHRSSWAVVRQICGAEDEKKGSTIERVIDLVPGLFHRPKRDAAPDNQEHHSRGSDL